jgi:hypothetical protein
MTKEQIIQEAYGDYWEKLKEFVDENGFCHERKKIDFDKIFSEIDVDLTGYEWRPKSLRGIEDNNGWIKIEDKSNLPKEDTYYLIHNIDGSTEIYRGVMKYLNKNYTHYLPITKPKPPLY